MEIGGSVDNKDIKKFEDTLLELPQIKFAKHIKSVESAITTSWGADPWTEKQIAIDCLQNYRDAQVEAGKEISNVKVSVIDDQITVYAPTTYNLKKLFYVGSDKAENDLTIGQNGEGQKKAFSDLARMGILNPINLSGEQALIVSIGKEIEGTELRPLVYNYFTINDVEGSYLIINTISKKLKDEFRIGMQNFFYSENPLIGEVLHSYNDITVFKSKEKDGICFYRGLARLTPGLPLVINIDKPYAALEKKTKQDRDRKAFDEKLRATYFSIFAKSGFYYHAMKDNEAIKYIINCTKHLWSKGNGHPLLSAIAINSYGSLKDDEALKKIFGKEFIAESKWTYSRDISYNDWFSTKTQNYIISRDSKEKKKKTMLPSYFTNFGILSSLESFIRNKANTEKRIKNKKTADLTNEEQKKIDFCFDAAKSISPSFAKLFKNDEYDDYLYDVKFKKIFCKDLLGELKNSSEINSKIIYLHQDLFKETFGKMFSVFLHELAHASGNDDGSREFSDSLTVLIQKCIDNNGEITKFSKQWLKFKK